MSQEATADRLFSRFIRERDGACQLAGTSYAGYFCSGPGLECAHLIRRGYKATRYEPLNAVALCHFHHRYMTEHPLAWNAWRSERLGPAFPVLWEKAQHGRLPDLPYVIANLRDELVR